jgi:hypothetical protein
MDVFYRVGYIWNVGSALEVSGDSFNALGQAFYTRFSKSCELHVDMVCKLMRLRVQALRAVGIAIIQV